MDEPDSDAGEVAVMRAFPMALRGDARAVFDAMPPTGLSPLGHFSVQVEGESLEIPERIYNLEPATETQRVLSPTQQAVLHAIYTRHHDGRVRQRHIEELFNPPREWVAPYVVRLIGEYVVEIIVSITRGLV